MAVDPKVLDRIGKLLRLAAPTSGTTEGERASAAIEAARLIYEHDIDVGIKETEPEPLRRPTVSRNVWVQTEALQYCSCSACHKIIARGDVVWVRVRQDTSREYRHNYEPCRVG